MPPNPKFAPGDDAMKDAFLTPNAMKDAFIAFPSRQLGERIYGGGH